MKGKNGGEGGKGSERVGTPAMPRTLVQKFGELWDVREAIQSPHDILIQAKALMLCALPYKRIPEKVVIRRAQLGRGVSVAVTFTAIGDADLPFGADRALFAWIQTRAYGDGFLAFDSLREFLRTFGLADDGRYYRIFAERLHRLKHLSVTVVLQSDDEEIQLNTIPIKAAYTPRTSVEARR